MKPNKLQYLFAQSDPMKVCLTAGPILCAVYVLRAIEPSLDMMKDFMTILLLVGVVLLSLPLGWFGAILILAFLFGPIYYDQGLRNGAPFHPGDHVRILAGPHRDRIVRVYSYWQGDSVRVELGEEEKNNYSDVFSPYQLMREEDADTAH